MKTEEYEKFVLELLPSQTSYTALGGSQEEHCSLGLAGEVGEAVDLVKKRIYGKKFVPWIDMALELGDVLFYLTGLAAANGLTLNDLMRVNSAKLRARYPDGSAPSRYKGRDQAEERRVALLALEECDDSCG